MRGLRAGVGSAGLVMVSPWQRRSLISWPALESAAVCTQPGFLPLNPIPRDPGCPTPPHSQAARAQPGQDAGVGLEGRWQRGVAT